MAQDRESQRVRAGNVARAAREVTRAEEELFRAVWANFPIGCPVSWQKGGCGSRVHRGYILGHGYRGRIRVRNEVTHKARWITFYDLYGGDE